MSVTVYLVFGAQGSGKSTQGDILSEQLDLPFFDTGHELRQLARGHNTLARSIAAAMKAGRLVGNQSLEVVINQFIARQSVSRGVVLDGFPRTLEEVKLLEKLARRYNWQVVGIYIKISDQTIKARLTKRARLENRTDDQPAIVAQRLAVFKAETLPVIDYIQKHYCLLEINGEPNPQAVSELILKAINDQRQ